MVDAATAGYLLRHGDVDGAIAAIDSAPKRSGRPVLTAEPAERDGRIYWCGEHLGTEAGRRILDVTDLGVHSVPLETVRLGGPVTEISHDAGRLVLSGDIVNPLGRIRAGSVTAATLEINDRRRTGRAFRVPAEVSQDGARNQLARGPRAGPGDPAGRAR